MAKDLGVDIETRSRLLRSQSIRTTQTYYVNLESTEAWEKVAEQWRKTG